MLRKPKSRLARTLVKIGVTALVASGLAGIPSAAHAAIFWVGVLPGGDRTCPGDSAFATPYYLHLDNEDSDNKNSNSGWLGGIASDRNTVIYLCAVPSSGFVTLRDTRRVNFAVVSLTEGCPSGSISIVRYFDDEDSNSQSDSNVPPGSSSTTVGGNNKNTTINFCWFLNDGSSVPAASNGDFPSLGGGSYGVFGGTGDVFGNPYLSTGMVHTDDEDSDNKNTVTYNPNEYYRNMWLVADRNTTMYIGRAR